MELRGTEGIYDPGTRSYRCRERCARLTQAEVRLACRCGSVRQVAEGEQIVCRGCGLRRQLRWSEKRPVLAQLLGQLRLRAVVIHSCHECGRVEHHLLDSTVIVCRLCGRRQKMHIGLIGAILHELVKILSGVPACEQEVSR
ncbi:MAG: hypothetical protein ACYCW6_22285 [Candidatus Xenobia bacterium]